MAEAGVPLPPVQPIDGAPDPDRPGQSPMPSAPLRMLFTLAQGKSRMVADPKGRGFFIVKTNKIVPGNAMTSPLLIAQTQTEFQRAVSDELGQQMLAAMKADQGVKRNEEAIAAAKRRITGAGPMIGRGRLDDRAAHPGGRQCRQLHLHAGRLSGRRWAPRSRSSATTLLTVDEALAIGRRRHPDFARARARPNRPAFRSPWPRPASSGATRCSASASATRRSPSPAARAVERTCPVHGKVASVRHDGSGLFAGLPSPFAATRYHSLAVPDPRPPLSPMRGATTER